MDRRDLMKGAAALVGCFITEGPAKIIKKVATKAELDLAIQEVETTCEKAEKTYRRTDPAIDPEDGRLIMAFYLDVEGRGTYAVRAIVHESDPAALAPLEKFFKANAVGSLRNLLSNERGIIEMVKELYRNDS